MKWKTFRATSHISITEATTKIQLKETNWNVEQLSVETRAIVNEIENYLCDLGPGINLFFLVLIRFFLFLLLYFAIIKTIFRLGFGVDVRFALVRISCMQYIRFHQNENKRRENHTKSSSKMFMHRSFSSLWHILCNKMNAKIIKRTEINSRNKLLFSCCYCCCHYSMTVLICFLFAGNNIIFISISV